MRRRVAVVLSALSLLTGVAVAPSPASAAVPGFDVRITEVPDAFTAGQAPGTLTAVASTVVGRACQKVRWSMVLRVAGFRLDQLRVSRIEETGAVPLTIEADGDTARLTDTAFDPGELCRGRTVTARYQVSVTEGAPDGQVTFQTEAYDRDQTLLQQATATSEVVGAGAAASPSPEPSSEPSAEPSEEPSAEPSASAPAAVDALPAGNRGSTSLLGVGLVVGAVLIFLGVGLLLRIRLRNRAAEGRGRLRSRFGGA